MGKYAKIALVLLYVVQLAVLFKDQLIHLYRDAVEAVHRQATVAHHRDAYTEPSGPRTSLFLKRSGTHRFDPKAELFAVPPARWLFVVGHGAHHHGDRHEPHPAHDDDKHKDRPKKRIVWPPRVILYANLFRATRVQNAHPQSVEPREEEEMLSLLLRQAAA